MAGWLGWVAGWLEGRQLGRRAGRQGAHLQVPAIPVRHQQQLCHRRQAAASGLAGAVKLRQTGRQAGRQTSSSRHSEQQA